MSARASSTGARRSRFCGNLLVFALQTIAGFARCQDVARARRVIFELAPQFGDVGVDSTGEDARRMSPDFFQEIEARHHGASTMEQRQQQIEFHRRERDRMAGLSNRTRREIDGNIAEPIGNGSHR